MLNVSFSPFPYLSTERCLLRPITEEDAEEKLFLRSDDRVLQYLDREKMRSIEEAKEFIGKINASMAANDGILWVISFKNDQKMIGSITYWRLMKEHYRAEIGYTLHPDHWGKGLMNEVMKAVLDYGFETMGLHSVEANVNPDNSASIRLLERNGFTREGYFKENYFFAGRFLDSAIYSLLAKNRP